MIDWLKRNVGDFIHKVEALGRAVLNGFVAIWNAFAGLMHILRVVFGDLSSVVVHFMDWLVSAVQSLVNAAKWIVTVLVPRTINYLIQEARKIANAIGSEVLSYARRLFDWVVNELNTARKWLEQRISDVLSWLWSRLSPIVDWVSRYGNRVVDLVLHPDKLVQWILPYLWGPLWRYLQGKAVPIGRWILGRSVAAVLAGAGLIESVLVKLI